MSLVVRLTTSEYISHSVFKMASKSSRMRSRQKHLFMVWYSLSMGQVFAVSSVQHSVRQILPKAHNAVCLFTETKT
jgi:hypothetical protein